MLAPQPRRVRSGALWLACLCFCCSCTCLIAAPDDGQLLTFRVGAIDCTLKLTGMPVLASGTLNCSSLQGVHVTTEEGMVSRILTEALTQATSFNYKFKKLAISFSHLHLSLESLSDSLDGLALQLQSLLLSHCAIQSLKGEFFTSKLFTMTRNSVTIRFHDCTFNRVACTDIATAFAAPLGGLEFVNCTWCPGVTRLSGLKLRDFMLRQPAAQPDSVLVITESQVANKLTIGIDSGWQALRLGTVRPGHLNLIGVELTDSLDPGFLKDANLYSLHCRRCRLPRRAADNLLRNVQDVDQILLDDTELDDVPLVPRLLSLMALELRNCRLGHLDFTRLSRAEKLKDMALVNASIDRLPESWLLVANGSILKDLVSINLTGNALRSLPHVTPPKNREFSHFSILVGGNPLHCDCGLEWLREAANADVGNHRLLELKTIYTTDDPRCATPETYRGKPISSLRSSLCIAAPPDDGASAEAGSSTVAIVVALVVALIVAAVLLFVCCKFKDRARGREGGGGKAKYTPANKEEVTMSDKTTMLRSDEAPGSRPTRV